MLPCMFGREGFKKFYKKNLNLSLQDYQEFLEAIERPLPRTFRNLSFTKEIKVADLPLLFDAGFLYSQEAVSALPHKLLQIERSHKVLDMCAAPGSKSIQILCEKVDLLVANEVSHKRCNVLISNLKKVPSKNVIVTSHDACLFPKIRLPQLCGEEIIERPFYFDRILCDVPCSSDGTVRKDPKILNNWKLNTSLFDVQKRILSKAAELLSEDGLIVYSTCSFNPIENEAVIQNFCEEHNFEVFDCSKMFDIEIKGRKTENQCLKENESQILPSLVESLYKIKESSEIAEVPRKFIFREGLIEWDPFLEMKEDTKLFFPKGNPSLKNCLRVIPSDQDTGGFFIAVLKRIPGSKASENAWKDTLKAGKIIDYARNSNLHKKALFGIQKFKEVDNKLSESIKSYYAMKSNDFFVTFSTKIRCVNSLAFVIINCAKRLKIITAGIEAFKRNSFSCEKENSYRLSFEYSQLVHKHTNRIINLTPDQFSFMLENIYLLETQIEGNVIFQCEGFLFPGFVNNKKGMLFINKVAKRLMKRVFA